MGAVRIWCAEKKKSVCRYSTWAVAVLLMLLPCHAIPGCVRPNKTPGRLKPFVHISPAHYAHYTHTRTHDMTHIHMTEPNGPLFPLCFRVFFFLYLFEDKKYIFTNICVSRLNESSIIPLTQRWCNTAHCGRTNRIQHRLSTIFFTVSSVTANDWLMWYFRHICIYLRLSRHSLH